MANHEKTLQELIKEGCEKHRRYKVRIAERTHRNLNDTYIFAEWLQTIEVQVKRFGIWLTVWAETCDYNDTDLRAYNHLRAEEVYDNLTELI